jgi:hypothetical protein
VLGFGYKKQGEFIVRGNCDVLWGTAGFVVISKEKL